MSFSEIQHCKLHLDCWHNRLLLSQEGKATLLKCVYSILVYNMVSFDVDLKCFPWWKHFCANDTALRLIIMQPLYVDPESVPWPKLLATLGAEVTLVKVVLLNVIGKVGLVSGIVVAHSASPAIAAIILSPHFHRHALDNIQQIWGKQL